MQYFREVSKSLQGTPPTNLPQLMKSAKVQKEVRMRRGIHPFSFFNPIFRKQYNPWQIPRLPSWMHRSLWDSFKCAKICNTATKLAIWFERQSQRDIAPCTGRTARRAQRLMDRPPTTTPQPPGGTGPSLRSRTTCETSKHDRYCQMNIPHRLHGLTEIYPFAKTINLLTFIITRQLSEVINSYFHHLFGNSA